MKTTILIPIVLTLACSASIGHAQVVEDFENGSISAWTTSGIVEIHSITALGSYAMRLKGDASAERAFATSGDVTVYMSAKSLETGDSCDVFVSQDGVNWGAPILTLNNGQDDGQFSSATATTTGGQTHIRYVQNGTSADYCFADNISIENAGPATPILTLSGSGSFGNVTVGSTKTNAFTITNTGNADLTVQNITGISAPFNLSGDTCSATTLMANEQCDFNVTFSPSAVGAATVILNINSNVATQSINVQGSGVDGTPPPPPSGDLPVFNGDGNVSRTALTLSQLNGSTLSMMDFSHYSHGTSELNADNSHAKEPSNTFNGRLVLNQGNSTALNFVERTSGRGIASDYNDPGRLPAFDFEFVQVGSHIIPKQRGLIVSGNIGAPDYQDWNYILEPGRVWDENADNGYSRVAIPFALQENQANCTHNGMITFAFKDDGSVTNAAVQVGGETCLYFQYDLWGMVDADYIAGPVANSATIVTAYESEVLNRLPVKPISALATDYPSSNVNVANIASEQASAPTTHGVLYNGVHYAAPCSTRYGDYPYCEVMSLPSYSTAKTAVTNFAYALLLEQDAGVRNLMISANVPECQDNINGTESIWSDVTIENALDMATGNYRLSSYEGDEGSTAVLNEFFLTYSHDDKIKHACERYIRKSAPNTHFSYHSSDTYIAGVALDNYTSGDLFDKLVNEVYKPLHLSPATYTTVRTQGAVNDPFWSHGMTWHADDMAKLGQLVNDRGVIAGQQVLNSAFMDEMLLQTSDIGLQTYGPESTYINGMWTYDMGQRTNAVCPSGSWVPYMSGYGGIGIVLFPNGAVYYYVSDSNSFAFGGAEAELHKISNICP